MKHRYLYTIACLIIMVILTACESGGDFRVINRTSFPLRVRLEGKSEQTVDPGQEHVFSVDTQTQTPFNTDVSETVKVWMEGDTYRIYDKFNLTYVDSTQIEIKAGKTVSAFIDPNRASIKIVNNSDEEIPVAEVYRHNFVSPVRIATLGPIQPGESQNIHVNFSEPVDASADPWIPTPATNYYYYVVLQFSPTEQLVYGSTDTILYNDQQFVVEYTNP